MKRFMLFLAIGALAVLMAPAAAVAQCNGYDQFQTGSGTSFDLGSGIGVVNFQGVSIDSSQYGNADTIIKRSPSGTSGVCNLSVFAMYLKSTSPVTLPGGSQADVYATINNTGGSGGPPQPDTLTASSGTMTLTQTSSSGGTFDSSLTVNADLIFVKPGTSPASSSNYVIPPKPAPGKTLVAVQIQYSTTPPPGYPGCLPADVVYVYQIAGAGHPHSVVAATTTACGGGTLGGAQTASKKNKSTTLVHACECTIAFQ